jgi:acylphosphatase
MPNAKPEGRARILVSGRVQGVGFRWFTVEAATSLGLAGTVRNLPGGDVEIVAEGSRALIERLIAAARSGPPGAVVLEVQVAWETPTGDYAAFHTAR